MSIDTLTLSPVIGSSTPRFIDAWFRAQMINEHLASYSQLYDNSSHGCNITKVANEQGAPNFVVISQVLRRLRRQMVPYPNEYFHGRGIVLTIGAQQLSLAKVNLKMIEHSDTRLPVQIWYSVAEISHETMIDLLRNVPKVNLSVCCFHTKQCRSSTQTWQLNSTYVYQPSIDGLDKNFPYKPAAILSATFAEVLFLDSDAYITRDPEELFLLDPMYLQFGALFYPDAHVSQQHPGVWQILNTSCGAREYELDSAAILVDKRRVWNGLYMTKLINDQHRYFYTFVTNGDKDTFRLGFRYMNVKYYIVMIPCATGRFNGSHFCGWTLCKTDSLAQHIYINHVHIFKYEGISYESVNFEYTRIGLGDPNNNSFFFEHCRLPGAHTSCFHIVTKPNAQISSENCYTGEIPIEEIENHVYQLNESLLFEKARNNQILISKTDNLMSGFVNNLLKYLR